LSDEGSSAGATAPPGYAAERLGSGELLAIEAVFNAVFSWKPVPPGFAAWRYASPEVQGLCVGVRESATGEVVAAHGLQLLRATSGALLGLSVDVMVHPAHQRLGLGALMEERVRAEAEVAGCAALMCFPNPKLASLREKLGQWEPALRARAYSAPASRFSSPATPTRWRVSDSPPAGIEALWQAARAQNPDLIGIERSAGYLAWRFTNNPLHRYKWVFLEAAGKLSGAAVTKVWADPVTGTRSGDIVDLLVPDPGTAGPAIVAACRQLQAEAVSKINLWAPSAVTENELERLGLEPDAQLSRTLQVRYPKNAARLDFSRWYLTQADTDLY